MKLKVGKASSEDVYRDIIRIPEPFRIDGNGRVVPEGDVCKLKWNGRSCRGIVRASSLDSEPTILLDERLRAALSVQPGEHVDLDISTQNLFGQFLWAWSASDPAYRVAARLALLSVLLGILGLVLGAYSVYLAP
jgi:hypothetical protein